MKKYIVEFRGEPVTDLSWEGNKPNVHTGNLVDAIRYTAEEAESVAAAIGTGAEAVRQ